MELCRASSPPWVHLNADWIRAYRPRQVRTLFHQLTASIRKPLSPRCSFFFLTSLLLPPLNRAMRPTLASHLLSPPELLHHAGNAFSACPISLRIEISTLRNSFSARPLLCGW